MYFGTALCPKCDKPVTGVDVKEVDGFSNGMKRWRFLAYSCRSCHAVLSLEMDPELIRNFVVSQKVQSR